MDTSKPPIARLHLAGEEYLLYQGQQVRLGRANENDLLLLDPKISRNHAVIEWNGSGFNLRDLGSVNGTFVNGERIASTRLLHDGDEITLSRIKLRYEIIRVSPGEPIAKTLSAGTTEPLVHRGAYLVVARGSDRGQEFPLWGEVITIGRASRDATWEIRLTDRSVSRPHARLERRSDGYYLIDLESVNGTSLNGARVQGPAPLGDGDVIGVGETHLVFQNR